METFGDRLKKKIKEKNMSAASVARDMNLTNRQNVTAWINGKSKPKADDLTLLSKILEVSIDWLLTGENGYPTDGRINIAMEDYVEYMKLKNEKLQKENASLKNSKSISV